MVTNVRSRSGLTGGWRAALLGAVLALALTGCKKLDQKFVERLCIDVGQCEEPTAQRRDYRVFCDRSQYSPCDLVATTATLKVLLPAVAKTPGSRLSLWMLTDSVGTTRSVAEVMSPVPLSKREQKQRGEQERWVATAEATLLKAAEPFWKTAQPKKSFIAAALTKIGMVDSSLSPVIVAITDGFEVERDIDFECGVVPGEAHWFKTLHRQGWLSDHSLSRTDILFTFMQIGPQPRCGANIARLIKVRSLWEHTLTAAGATVSFSTGVVQLGERTLAQAGHEGGRP